MKRSPLTRKVGLKPSRKPMKRSPLRKVSKKLAPKLKQYSIQRKRFLEENTICPVTGLPTVDVHHAFGRGPYLLDESTWIAVSREGHDWIHAHPNQARAKGWLK